MVSPASKCFLPGEAGFSGFLAQRSRTNKCQHLCQMGAGWSFCAPQVFKANFRRLEAILAEWLLVRVVESSAMSWETIFVLAGML
jgi:hypothetical protein